MQTPNATPFTEKATDGARTTRTDDAVADLLLDAYLSYTDGISPADALAAAGRTELARTESELIRALGPGAPEAGLARRARGLLAAAYRRRRDAADARERGALVERAAIATARCRGANTLSLVVALREAGASVEVREILDAAADRACSWGYEETSGWDAIAWVRAMRAAPSGEATDAIAIAALALEPGGRGVGALAAAARSPQVLRFLAMAPEVRSDGQTLAALASSPAPGARACAAWAIACADEEAEALARAALGSASGARRFEQACDLYRAVWEAAGAVGAASIARAFVDGWAPPAPLPLHTVPRGLEGRVDFLAALGAAFERRPDSSASIGCYEGALAAYLEALEEGACFGPMRAALEAAAALTAAGQGSAVATQLLGAGAGALAHGDDRLVAWAELNLRLARRLAAQRRADATLFYVNLLSIFGRAPERLAQFGAAAPLLSRVADRLHEVGTASPSSEGAGRPGRERHFHDLAGELGALDASTATPESREQGAPETEKRAFTNSTVAEGLRRAPSSRWSLALRVLSGYELLRGFARLALRGLGLRHRGRVEVSERGVAVESETWFLGQRVRCTRDEILPTDVLRIECADRSPGYLLALGVAVLVVLTWFGASIAYDGFLIEDPVLVAGGLGAIAAGLLVDGALYGSFLAIRGAVTLSLHLKSRKRPLSLSVPRDEAPRLISSLAEALGIIIRHKDHLSQAVK